MISQVVMNFRRKSVVGFNFDYLGYDYAGFISFTLYNCLIFFSPAVFGLYQTVYPGAANPIQSNDVLFCIHAMLIQVTKLFAF
jgi:cystinosin